MIPPTTLDADRAASATPSMAQANRASSRRYTGRRHVIGRVDNIVVLGRQHVFAEEVSQSLNLSQQGVPQILFEDVEAPGEAGEHHVRPLASGLG
ncbi:MAG: hypothetical protein M3Z46_00550 [Actinomycetota bacterium]|nr:hypothetical protein [Actinomycetota bacterium]